MKWVEKGLNIDLSAAVTVEDVGRALGLWSDEKQQQQEQQHQEQLGQEQQHKQEEQLGEEQQHEQQERLGQEINGVEPAENELILDSRQNVGEYYAEEATIGMRDHDSTGAGEAAVS